MKYLQLVKTDAELIDPKLDSPVVMKSEESHGVWYFKKTTPVPTYEHVNLGLSVEWTTFNLGATKPEECGNYYAWGETNGYTGITSNKQFNSGDYEFTTDSGATFIKYNSTDELSRLESCDDAVSSLLGGNYRMPTHEELLELSGLTKTSDTVNGVSGIRFSASNGNSIFIPYAGFCGVGKLRNTSSVFLWSSNLYDGQEDMAKCMIGYNGGIEPTFGSARYRGFSIRPVYVAPYEFIDLGLSVKWATFNLGATKPEEYGKYYSWGDTTGYTGLTSDRRFILSEYKWYDNETSTYKKYNSTDGLTNLQPSDDAATCLLGEGYRMPTKSEIDELVGLSHSAETLNGISGTRITGKNGNSIFIPYGGYLYDGYSTMVGRVGNIMSSSIGSSNENACALASVGKTLMAMDSFSRYWGCPIRPVCEK